MTSWGELNRDGVEIEKEKLRHPDRPARVPYVTQVLAETRGPAVAVSDWMRGVPEQIRPWVPNTYATLGTDGFGFSDTRPAARRYYNTDAESVVVAVLEALATDGEIDQSARRRGRQQVPDRRRTRGAGADFRPRRGVTRGRSWRKPPEKWRSF